MIIVTGGAGFIGSNIVKRFNDRWNYDIVIVDRMTPENIENVSDLIFQDFIDLGDIEAVESLKDIEAIFHQGACSATTETDGEYLYRNNYDFSKRMLQLADSQEADFYYASSASVYGNGEEGFLPLAKCERPLNLYAFFKLQFDRYAMDFAKRVEPTYKTIGMRYFNVYGPREQHKGQMASVPFHLYKKRHTGKLKVFEGSENFRRDFIHVDDIVDINMFFYDLKETGYSLVNCGTGEARSFMELAEIAKQEIKEHVSITKIPFPPHLEGRYQKLTEANLDHLRSWGYAKPMTSLEEGIKRYYEALR